MKHAQLPTESLHALQELPELQIPNEKVEVSVNHALSAQTAQQHLSVTSKLHLFITSNLIEKLHQRIANYLCVPGSQRHH